MTNILKVGDKVQINEENCKGFGQFLYSQYGVVPGNTYTVSAVKPDENPDFNEQYGGYIDLEGVDEGWYVMEDFEAIGGDAQ